MKRFSNDLKKGVMVVVCILCVISCEKPEANSEITNLEPQEVSESKGTQPLLYMHFDGNMSEEEVHAKFDVGVKKYFSKNNIGSKGASTEWFYRVTTKTGSQTNHGSNGRARISVYFVTDNNTHYDRNAELNTRFSNDRARGAWDIYLFKTNHPDRRPVRWVEAKSAYIDLQGRDDWFLESLTVSLYPDYQNVPATGASSIYSEANIWLKNDGHWDWDPFQTGHVGTGRLNF